MLKLGLESSLIPPIVFHQTFGRKDQDTSFDLPTKVLPYLDLNQIIGEEFGQKKTKSDYTWVIDPIDGTRSFVIGNPTWSNLISLNYKGTPILGLQIFQYLKNTILIFQIKLLT